MNTNIKDQKRTNRCSAFGCTTAVEIMLTRRLRKKIWIDPAQLWQHQKTRRSFLGSRYSVENWDIEKKGDTMDNVLMSLIENGLIFNDYDENGKAVWKKVTFDGFSRIRGGPKECEKWIRKGHPLITGSGVFDNYIKDGFWLVSGVKRWGAHLFVVPTVRYNFKLENSWGNRWGDHGATNLFRLDMQKCFGPYVLYGMKVIDT